ncbi:MAG TPA: hypothetical protein VH374_19425 [Polyangia bacterium]|nr:hypothetical protein [Polyangia bacterium]
MISGGCGPDKGGSSTATGGSNGNASGGSNGSGGNSGTGSGGDNGSGGGSVTGTGGDNGDNADAAGTGGDNSGTGGASAGTGGMMMTGTSSGLPRTTAIGDLTDDQKPTLCDWWNNKQGGYGQTAMCPGADDESDDADQDDCVSSIDDCDDATVADFEDCGNAIGTDLCMFRTATACATLTTCFGDD